MSDQDISVVPSILSEPLTKEEEETLKQSNVTGYERRAQIRDEERKKRLAGESGSSSTPSSESMAAPIGSSELASPNPIPKENGGISEQMRALIPGLSTPEPEPSSSESASAQIPGKRFAEVPDLLEDIRESVARIQDRSYLLDQKTEYPPRAPPVEPVVAPDELCSRKYGFCRTIPMILTDIALHLRTIATVPSREQLLKNTETSPFQKSQVPLTPVAAPAPPYAQGSRPPFGPRPPFAQGQGPRPPFAQGQGPRPPFAQGQGPPARNQPTTPDPDAPVPKPNSAAPPQVDAENTNDDAGDGLGDGDGGDSPKRGGGGYDSIDEFDDDFADAFGGDILDTELDDHDYPNDQYNNGVNAVGTGGHEGDGYYKIVNINHPEPM